jgi:hypothetical protein
MRWRKLGRIFTPPTGLGWMVSHAALPVVERRGPRHRVYFGGRDAGGRSRIGAFEVDFARPDEVLAVSEAPLLGLGPLGSFDDAGVTPSCAVTHGGRTLHYYTGWTLGVSVPFYLFVGGAVSEDAGLTLTRISPAPILGRGATDPYLTASPWVLIEEGRWRMWYVSGSRWEAGEGPPRHYYHIRYAESSDGLEWTRRGTVCVDYASPDEHAISRPCVVKDADRYRMWYAYRGPAYRIGYAESPDGIHWVRRDGEAGIDVSPAGWDSEMLAYPCVFDHDGRRYMLYNGNGYGRTGIGLAVLDEAPTG